MSIPTSLSRAASRAVQTTSQASTAQFSDPAALRARPKQQLRRYDVCALLPNGDISETRHIAPALPLFEDAFCAFSRGTLIPTPSGHIAIEDLLPGDEIVTAEGSMQTLLWKGTTTLVPARPGPQGRNMRLTRVVADAFGMQRPLTNIVAGPSARILYTPPHLRGDPNHERKLTLAREFVDGMNVIETAPPTPVELFHLCLKRHSTIRVGGLEFESYHPGANAARQVSHQMRALFFDLFTHVDQFSDFGKLAFPRVDDDLPQNGALIA